MERPRPVTIDDLRRRIDELDEQLVRLLSERAVCVRQIGRLKQTLRMAIYQPGREAEVLRRVRDAEAQLGGPLGPEAMARVFERIIDEARRIERDGAEDGHAAPTDGEDRDRRS